MVRDRLRRYVRRVRRHLREAFEGHHTPHQIAASFAIGIFLTALPTGGLGVGLFFVFVRLWSWVNKVAIFSTVIVLNPFVKPAVYVASYNVGDVVVGSEPVIVSNVALIDYVLIAIQLTLLGNLLVAAGLSCTGYGIVYGLARRHRRRSGTNASADGSKPTTRTSSEPLD